MGEHDVAPSFEPEELGFQLAATPIPRVHQAFGEGFRYALGPDPESPHADVEVYPAAKLIRYTSEGFQITLRGDAVSGEYHEGGVVFRAQTDTEHRSLTISRFGDLIATVTPLPVLPGETLVPEEEEPAVPANDPILKPTENPTLEREKQERVALLGRAGRDAQLRQTAKGTDIAKFPLAVHELDETGQDQTSWHTIVAFNGLAREVAETVKKGNEYKVIGYKHERQDKDKTIEEIYAATVKPPSKKKGGEPNE